MNHYDENKISLCPVKPCHEDFLFRLFIESRPDLALISGLDEHQKSSIIYQQFIMEEQQLRIIYPEADFNIVMIDSEPIGRLFVYHGEKTDRIIEIALLENYRGIGIGTKLMSTVIEEAMKYEKSITLQVGWFNEKAYKFYEKLGFKIVENKGVSLEMKFAN